MRDVIREEMIVRGAGRHKTYGLKTTPSEARRDRLELYVNYSIRRWVAWNGEACAPGVRAGDHLLLVRVIRRGSHGTARYNQA